VLKLGYKASAEQFAPAKLLAFSTEAEAVGLDSVFVSDHFQPWKHVDGHAPFSLTWLGALGARTSRVVMGTSVLTPTFRYHPSIVAQAFGTLGSMFPGRVILGIGTGESLNEVPSTGQPWPEFKERFARMREAVTLIRTLWRGERISFEGEYYKTEKATIYDRPEQEIPIYVAAAGALVARYAGRTGDGFICTSGKKWDLYTDTLLPKVAEGIAAAPEPKKQPYDHMIEIKLSFDSDKQCALDDTRHWAALALTPEEKMTVEDPVEMQRLADALPIEKLLIDRLLGAPQVPKEVCYYSVPADPIDFDMNVVYHKGIFNDLLTKLGYSPKHIIEGHCVVFAELDADDFTGIGISCGGGMFNICVAYKTMPALSFATCRGGDYIDRNVAKALGIKASRATAIKEKGVDLRNPRTREEQVISIYYRELISYTLNKIKERFEASSDVPQFPEPIDIVFAGGTSKIGGFIEVVKDEFSKMKFPIPIKEIRRAEDAFTSVARGSLVAAAADPDNPED